MCIRCPDEDLELVIGSLVRAGVTFEANRQSDYWFIELTGGH